MGDRSLEECVTFAGDMGFDALEVHTRHLPAQTAIDEADRIKALFDENQVAISSIAAYGNVLAGDRDANIAMMKQYVDACVALGTDCLCALTGMAVEGKSKEETIASDFKEVFTPIAQYAGEKGIKVAFENWFATLIQHFEQWDAVLEALPFDNVGFNYDPSHLIWQGIDYIGGVEVYKDHIFHTHAKDTQIKDEVVAVRGNQCGGWWKYVIPGFGCVEWGKYIRRLRDVGFDGVLSIEHEDGSFTPDEGLEKGLQYLRLYA